MRQDQSLVFSIFRSQAQASLDHFDRIRRSIGFPFDDDFPAIDPIRAKNSAQQLRPA
jgi:hypothetical protein